MIERVTDPDSYDWRHGWVPLTWRAALQKAHGNHEQAARLLGEAKDRRARRRAHAAAAGRFVTPHPVHQAEHRDRVWRALDDDQLAEAMGTADDATVDRIVAELERRDRAQRKVAADRERRARRRSERDAEREAAFDRLCDEGTDAEEAYRRAYGVTEERQRREEAIASLRATGYRGRSFDALVRDAFSEHAANAWLAAENATNGYLLSKKAAAAGVNPRSLFTGPEARARKHASEELLRYWQDHGRLTVDDFRASILGGHMRHTGTAAFA